MRILSILCIYLIIINASAQAQAKEENISSKNGFTIFLKDNKYAFKNASGTIIAQGFDAARDMNEDYAAVSINDKWGFIDEAGKQVIPCIYDIVFDYKKSVSAVYLDGNWKLIDKNNQEISGQDPVAYLENIRGVKLPNLVTPARNPNYAGTGRTQNSPCPVNLAFEDGNFNNWNCSLGSTDCSNGNNVTTMSPSAPTSNRHTIITRSAVSALDAYGLFPINPPDGSNHCVKLGNTNTGQQAERIQYNLNIPAGVTNYSVTFRYAVVFQDPGHTFCEQPRFTAKLFDPVTNTYLPCGSFEFVASSALPGFSNSTIAPNVKYKPWATVFINLAAYAGRNLQLEFTTVDCTQGGHWGYAYVDVDNNCDLSAQMVFGCNNNAATLTAPDGFNQYNWWNSGFTTVLGNTQTFLLNPAPPFGSTLWVEVIPYNGFGCRDTLPVTSSRIYPLTAFNNPAPQCFSNNAFNFSSSSTIAVGNIQNFLWDFGDGNTGTGLNVSHSYSQPGSYPVKLKVTSNLGCPDSLTRPVVVHSMPQPLFTAPAAQCLQGNNYTFSGTNGSSTATANSYTWSFGDGQNAAGTSSTHTYNTAGLYDVKLKIISVNGCADSIERPVRVHPMPSAVLFQPANTQFCEGSNLQLTASGGQTYQWYLNGQLISNASANTLNASQAGTYSVTAVSNFGCKATASTTVQLSLFIKPNAEFLYPLVCEGNPLNFSDQSTATNSGALTWLWNFGDGTTSSAQHPSHTYTWGGNYKVSLTVAPAACPNLTSIITKKVPVEKKKQGIRYQTINAIQNMSTHFYARKIGTSFLWGPATGLTDPTIWNPVMLSTAEREYTVRITTPLGCTTVDTQLVRIYKQIDIVAPKAFTPNGDGHNDKLEFFLLGIDDFDFFRVFNRWGQLMFETRDRNQFWDGKYRSQDQPLETYVWMAQGKGRDGVTIVRRGQTILIR